MKLQFRKVILLGLIIFSGELLAQDPLHLDGEKAMKNLEELQLAQFTVAFMTSEGKTASTQSRDNFNGAKSKLMVVTRGLTPELMQRITDDAYADFIDKAEANGFSVSDYDIYENLKEGLKDYYPEKSEGNFLEDCDHYQAYGKLTTITVSAKGEPCLCYDKMAQAGLAASSSKTKPIVVSYLLGTGYLQAKAKVTENDFFGEIYNKTSVTFLPGLQVWWRSGVDIWESKSKKGEIKINAHVYVDTPPGELVTLDKSELISRSSATLAVDVNPEKYYQDAMTVLKEANNRLIAAMAKAR